MKLNKWSITVLVQLLCWLTIAYSVVLANPQAVESAPHIQVATPTPSPFLHSPYYRQQNILQVFDHDLPLASTGDDNNLFVIHYDGTQHNPDPTRPHYPHNIPNGYGYDEHGGIDYNLKYAPVLAGASGTVFFAGWNNPNNRRSGYGLYVILDHSPAYNYRTYYAHLSNLVVKTGDTIEVNSNDLSNRKRIIGIGGNSGSAIGCNDIPVHEDPTCGQHLHFEVRKIGLSGSTNPYGWIGQTQEPWAQHTPMPGANFSGYPSYNLWVTNPALHTSTQYPGTAASPIPHLAAQANHTFPGEVIVDDLNSPYFTTSGTCWTIDTPTTAYSTTLRTATVNASPNQSCYAQWKPPANLTPYQEYDVYVHVAGGTTLAAPYTVRASGQLSHAIAVQNNANANNASHPWVYIGRYRFALSGNDEYIRLNNQTFATDTANGQVVADAIKFIPLDPDVVGYVQANNRDAGHHALGTTCVNKNNAREIYFGHCNDTNQTAIISGFNFAGLDIPQGATIQKAYLRFIIDGTYTNQLDLQLRGELAPHSSLFSSGNLPSTRPLTNAAVSWGIPTTDEWKIGSAELPNYRYSPDVTTIVQEIVNQPTWHPGNNLSIIVRPNPGLTPNGHRRVFAWERVDQDFPPADKQFPTQLFVWLDTGTNTPPPPEPATCNSYLEQGGKLVIEAENYEKSFAGGEGHEWFFWNDLNSNITGYSGNGAMIALPNSGTNTNASATGTQLRYKATFQNPGQYYVYVRGMALGGSHQNDSIHFGFDNQPVTMISSGGLDNFNEVFKWRGQHKIGNVYQDITINVHTAGEYTLHIWMREDGVLVDKIFLSQLRQNGLHGSTSVGSEPPSGCAENSPNASPITIRVSAPNDDAEEDTISGIILRNNEDLDMAIIGNIPQIIGVRFNQVAIPRQATITNAYLEFSAYETDNQPVILHITVQEHDNAPPFTYTLYGLDGRLPAPSAPSATWAVPAWTNAQALYQTPDLSPIIQAIVNRSGWNSGNALVFLITQEDGTGKRSAITYDTNPNLAPLLHVDFAPPAATIPPPTPTPTYTPVPTATPIP